jgi:tetratricopeptide (TPR) repeat protein
VLSDAWQEVRRKSPRIVVITSDPGVGKTTLANAFASSCQMDGAVVARAQAYEAERELPFAVLGELVRQLASQRAIGGADPEALSELTRISSEILRVFPGVPKPVEWAPELMPLRIADAFLKTVTAAAGESPVMLVVDDIHAADNASTAILHSVARKLNNARVLLIVTGRISELRLSGAPWALASDPSIAGMRSIELEILSTNAAHQLVCQLIDTAVRSSAPIERIIRASGGNPLAVELLTKEWAKHGPASLLHDLEALNTHPVPSLGIPRAISAVFDRQSRRLDRMTRATLDLAAILGRRLTDSSLYAALDISPAMALESLSRLKEEGLLREVRGDLEFRNELIRAQAYYAVASAVRLHLHRNIAELLAERPATGDAAALALEIAWHYLRGGSGEEAIPFAHRGAEAFLSIGAPHEAEEVLRALLEVDQQPSILRQTELLLAKALLDQSKAEEALPLIIRLTEHEDVSLNERAEVAMLRASAEFLLNNEPGEKYCEVASAALDCATKTGDPYLISRALFECARAGSEQGVTKLVEIAEEGVKELQKSVDLRTVPIAFVTQAFCRMFRMDSAGFLKDLGRAFQENRFAANPAQMSFTYSAMALASFNLCRFNDAFDAYLTAFEMSKKVGDDARMSVLASNLCVLETARGSYLNAIKWGEMSITLGEASNSSALQMTYTNLVDAYVLTGRGNEAVALMERAREWLVPKRRWKFHCGFLVVSAAFELTRGNISLALDIIRDVEAVARGREEANPIPGPYWKLRIFKSAHLVSTDEAWRMVEQSTAMFRANSPLQYLDILAAKTWLEVLTRGENSETTLRELDLFDSVGALGRKALLTAQGFLKPWPSPESSDGSGLASMAPSPSSQTPSHLQGGGSRATGWRVRQV